MPHYATIATLIALLGISGLNNAVIKHCKTGLKVIAIIYNNPDCNSRKNILSRKKFDAFFALFPSTYFNNRELISSKTVLENIEICIKTNNVANAA
ncbi:hypothetical protein GCM10022397_10460 [Flavivirga jejuensis]